MTTAEARQLAQTDPITNLTRTAGELALEIRRQIDNLTATLRTLDTARDALNERGVTFDVDLGPIGNVAASTRRDLERDRPGPTFELPR